MIRKLVKQSRNNNRLNNLIKKYQIKEEFLSVNRKSVARAVMVGLFIAFIPMPFQMVAVLLVLPCYHFNAPIGLAMVWVTNPITMPFIYYIEYKTGNFLLLREEMSSVQMSMEWFQDNFDAIFVSLYVGAFFYSTLSALGGYWLISKLWIQSVQRAQKLRKK